MRRPRTVGAPTSPRHAAVAARLRRVMEERGHTRKSLAAALGVTETMVGFWRSGKYLPSMTALDLLDGELGDGRLRRLVRDARTGRCPCGTTFDRTRSRRTYCSFQCQRDAHKKGGRKADPRQDAIDAMCAGCEPEGICRDDSCALRTFSPFLFVALHRRSA